MTLAQQIILESFDITPTGLTYCPYLKCSGDKDPHNYFAKDLWLEICKEIEKQFKQYETT